MYGRCADTDAWRDAARDSSTLTPGSLTNMDKHMAKTMAGYVHGSLRGTSVRPSHVGVFFRIIFRNSNFNFLKSLDPGLGTAVNSMTKQKKQWPFDSFVDYNNSPLQ